jgi:hypothetical protein
MKTRPKQPKDGERAAARDNAAARMESEHHGLTANIAGDNIQPPELLDLSPDATLTVEFTNGEYRPLRRPSTVEDALKIADDHFDCHRGPQSIHRYVVWDYVGAEIDEAIEITEGY